MALVIEYPPGEPILSAVFIPSLILSFSSRHAICSMAFRRFVLCGSANIINMWRTACSRRIWRNRWTRPLRLNWNGGKEW